MKLITRIKNMLRRSLAGGGRKGAVVTVTGSEEEVPSGLSLATVYRCVRVLSEAVASMPLIYETTGTDGLYGERDVHMNYLLQVEPQERVSAFEWMRQLVQHLLLRGNAYIVPIRDESGWLQRLVLLTAGSVAYVAVPEKYIVADTRQGISGVFLPDEIIHIRNFTPDGEQGVSTLTSARHTLGIVGRGDAETSDRLTSGGGIRGVVSSPQVYDGAGLADDDEIEDAGAEMERKLNSGRRIVAIPQTLDFKQLSLSSTDLQFLETRKFEVREVCRFFGVHPTYVFDDTSNNYKSAELANAAFLSQTLNPLLRNIESEFQRKLCGEVLQGRARFRFDRGALFVADRETDVRFKSALLSAGLRTPNELRRDENRPAVADGDTLLVSANLRPISDIVNSNNNDNNEQE